MSTVLAPSPSQRRPTVAAGKRSSSANRRSAALSLLTAPYWAGSGLPAPSQSGGGTTARPRNEAGAHLITSLRRIAHRLWLQRITVTLARSLWLPLLLLVLAAIAGGFDQARTLLDRAAWLWAGSIGGGVIVSIAARPDLTTTARLLDRSFALQDRLQTAIPHVGVAGPTAGTPAPLAYLQLADAANAASALSRFPAFRVTPPVREVALALVVSLTLTGLFFIDGMRVTLPPVADGAIPAFVSAAERMSEHADPPPATNASAHSPSIEEIEAMAASSAAARADLLLLADALADHAVTSEVAGHIRRGDYASAATELRTVAATADQLAPATRDGLAADLNTAADRMSGVHPGLPDATRAAAGGLQAGGEEARSGLTGLADAIDATAREVVSQSELARQRSEAQQSADGTRQGAAASPEAAENGENQADSRSPDASATASSGSQDASQTGGQTPSSGSGADASQGQPTPGADETDQAVQTPSSVAQGAKTPESGDPSGDEQTDGQDSPADGDQEASSDPGEREGEGEPGPSGTGEDVETGTGVGEPTQASESENTPDATVTPAPGDASLSLSGESEETVEIGGGDQQSTGSGGGSASGDGDVSQGVVADSGPDSNRVPEEYRDLVEQYFDREDD